MKYKIVLAGNPDDLEGVVNERLLQGWRPQGGTAVVYVPDLSSPLVHYQALVWIGKEPKAEKIVGVEQAKALRQLMEEAYGALGWLKGSFHLSNRARAYKVKKLQKALAEAEVCLQSLARDEPTAEEVEQAAWAFWTERVKALLVEEGISLRDPDSSATYLEQMHALYKIYQEGQAPEIAVSELLRARRLAKKEVKDVKQS